MEFQAPAASDEGFGAGQVTLGISVGGGQLLSLACASSSSPGRLQSPVSPTPGLYPLWQSHLHNCRIASQEALESFLFQEIVSLTYTAIGEQPCLFLLRLVASPFAEMPLSHSLVKKPCEPPDQKFSNFLVSGSLYTLKHCQGIQRAIVYAGYICLYLPF